MADCQHDFTGLHPDIFMGRLIKSALFQLVIRFFHLNVENFEAVVLVCAQGRRDERGEKGGVLCCGGA